ncbi:MAG: Crp/Fnr family transcriptional regulator [Planctomycetes bacterium]|nr:Crp/Fnr family transcriptional regulator [Planctomycetota bacterium]
MTTEMLKKQDFFKLLRPDQVHVLSNYAQRIEYKAGEIVFERGARANFFYIVLDGSVALRMQGTRGTSVVIDQVSEGNMFGRCISFNIDTFYLSAQCMEPTTLLRIEASVLKEIMDEDPRMGYIFQSQISAIYFRRYIDTMKKLQAIVMNIPLELDYV